MALAPTPTADATMPAADDTAPVDDTGGGDTVLVTICKSADGTYTVYAGDEPEEGGVTGEETTGDAAGAATGASIGDAASEPAGDETAPQGEHCETVGTALKAAMTILHDDESGSEGGAEGAFQSGYGDTGGQAPPLAQKY